MTDTTQAKRIVITLTGRRPVRIRDDEWPTIAIGRYKDWDNQYEFQANRTWSIVIRVRAHADGRHIVYGIYDYDTKFQGEDGEHYKRGVLIEQVLDGEHLASVIHKVADQLVDAIEDQRMHRHVIDAANQCIGDLAPEEL